MSELLSRIHSPADLKSLSSAQLRRLAQEIRAELISSLSRTGGHLAPNLGVVELTIALHRELDSPHDKIIWDVGHQSYVHKMLTGRTERFPTLKQLGGLSGYCKRSESPHDIFEAGHGCTSISAALGFAKARDLRGGSETIVAVIGDGSITGGLALEALNNAGHLKTDLIVILNDNEMSIAPNVGAIAGYLGRLRTVSPYLRAKHDFAEVMHRLPMGEFVLDAVERVKDGVKQLIVPGMLFEELGLTYLGPVDGHDIDAVRQTLSQARKVRGPVLIHCLTRKGKGYPHAEQNAFKWHSTSAFDVQSGKTVSSGDSRPTYTKVFVQALIQLAERDPRIVAITAAMPDGTGLIEFGERFPDRFFDVGMAEQHAVTFAGGLAAAGMRPVAAIYSTFLQRGYDQIIHDICIQNLPVVFCLDRGGIAGEDGPTHQGVFDVAYLRCVPNMTVMAPKDEEELRRMLLTALQLPGPAAIRYPKGAGPGATLSEEIRPLSIGEGEILQGGDDVAILALGYGVQPALQAAHELALRGIRATVINARFAKPLDERLIVEAARRTGRLVTVEDGVLAGGFGSAVLETLERNSIAGVRVLRLGLPDQFIEHGARNSLLEKHGLVAAGIVASIRELLAGDRGRRAPETGVGGESRRQSEESD
jgi:1-deoxy-D-xylulose-5-phosphate synthase